MTRSIRGAAICRAKCTTGHRRWRTRGPRPRLLDEHSRRRVASVPHPRHRLARDGSETHTTNATQDSDEHQEHSTFTIARNCQLVGGGLVLRFGAPNSRCIGPAAAPACRGRIVVLSCNGTDRNAGAYQAGGSGVQRHQKSPIWTGGHFGNSHERRPGVVACHRFGWPDSPADRPLAAFTWTGPHEQIVLMSSFNALPFHSRWVMA